MFVPARDILRRQALRDNPNLKDLLAYARAQDRSEAQATSVEKGVSCHP